MMNKIKKKYKNRKTLKVNENNNIESIIELFQKFGKKYNVITTTLEPNIQYQTKNMKITQTYTKTISKQSITSMIKQLQDKGKITLLIIDNMEKESSEVKNKIEKINELKNVNTKEIEEKDTFNALEDIINGV